MLAFYPLVSRTISPLFWIIFPRKNFLYFLKQKSEAYNCFKHFIEYAHTQTGMKIKRVRTDNGGEYINKGILRLFTDKGIAHEKIILRNSESDG